VSIKKVNFQNSSGDQLAAIIEMPDGGEPAGFAVFAHCFTCNKNLTAVKNIGKALTDNGIAVLRFDFTGLGESEGDFENTNFSSNIDDLIAAANYLEASYKAPGILIGHSLGGAAVLVAAAKIESIKAVATIGAPSSPGHVSHLFKSGIEEINTNGIAEVSIGGRSFTIKKQFLEDIEEKSIHHIVHRLKRPLLIIHSRQDNTVGIENAGAIYQSAMHPKSFISLDGADHLLSNVKDSVYAGHMIATWAKRYI
jgi:putative redox protein